MIGFIIDLEFVWGFQAKVVGYSKSSPAFTYPPPTMLLGAIAEVLAKKHSLGEEEGKSVIRAISSNLLAIGVKPLNCVPMKFADINKVIAVRRTGEGQYPNPQDPYGSFDAPAHGRTFLSSVSESDDGPTLRYILTLSDNKILVRSGESLQVESDDLWEIHRLGSKESVVAVTNVESFIPSARDGRITTSYSFPIGRIEKIRPINYSPKWILEKVINPFMASDYDPLRDYILGQNLMDLCYPIILSPQNPPRYIVEVGGGVCFYETEHNREREGVIGLRTRQ